jgi:hypothetical protein
LFPELFSAAVPRVSHLLGLELVKLKPELLDVWAFYSGAAEMATRVTNGCGKSAQKSCCRHNGATALRWKTQSPYSASRRFAHLKVD